MDSKINRSAGQKTPPEVWWYIARQWTGANDGSIFQIAVSNVPEVAGTFTASYKQASPLGLAFAGSVGAKNYHDHNWSAAVKMLGGIR